MFSSHLFPSVSIALLTCVSDSQGLRNVRREVVSFTSWLCWVVVHYCAEVGTSGGKNTQGVFCPLEERPFPPSGEPCLCL